MKFIVYEIWTRAVVVEAESEEKALLDHDPDKHGGELNLSNWHAVAVPEMRSSMSSDVALRAISEGRMRN